MSLAVDLLDVILRRLLLLPALALGLAGCGAASTPARPALVSATVSAPVPVDAALLRGLPRKEISLHEPFELRRMTFQVVALRDVLARAGVTGGAAKAVHAVALNDYVIDIPLAVATADGAYLAVGNGDGSAIPVDSGGPTRIVFADGATGADVENYWIWSLATVTAR